MHSKRFMRHLGLVSFASGAFFLLLSQPALTGFSVGIIGTPKGSPVALFLVFFGVFMFVSGLEKKIKVIDAITDKGLIRAAHKANENKYVNLDITNLKERLSEGHLECGIGTKGLGEKTGICYLRGRHGGRLFVRQTEDGYEIVGIASKTNEEFVIKRLRELYGR